MARRRRSKTERSRDANLAARMYLKGYSYDEIAVELGVSKSTVSRTLAPFLAEWDRQTRADVQEIKAREVARLDHLLLEYWEAWERSKKPQKSSTVRTGGAADDDSARRDTLATVRSTERNGDPRFLTGVQWVIDRRIKLYGLDEPAGLELTLTDETMLAFLNTVLEVIEQNVSDEGIRERIGQRLLALAEASGETAN